MTRMTPGVYPSLSYGNHQPSVTSNGILTMDTGMPFQHNHDASVPECLQVSPVLPVPLHQRSFHPGRSPQHITARINVLCMNFK